MVGVYVHQPPLSGSLGSGSVVPHTSEQSPGPALETHIQRGSWGMIYIDIYYCNIATGFNYEG